MTVVPLHSAPADGELLFSGKTLSYSLVDDAVEVTLHREPCNEIGETTVAELEGLLARLKTVPHRAVVFTSAQRAGFSAGADLRSLHEAFEAQPEPKGRARSWVWRQMVRVRTYRFLKRIHRVFDALDTLPVPTIAAVHGVCFGGGLELALTCDLIVAEKPARFAFPELRLGLVPGFGGIPRLERDVGNAVVRDLLLTGRTVRASRMQQIGAVHQVVARGEALRTARALARQAARFDAETVSAAKRFAKRLPARRLSEERRRFCALITEPPVREALKRFVTSTDPRPYLP